MIALHPDQDIFPKPQSSLDNGKSLKALEERISGVSVGYPRLLVLSLFGDEKIYHSLLKLKGLVNFSAPGRPPHLVT
jgi:hypothetical protein